MTITQAKGVKGVWFYGLSGAGKSHASRVLYSIIKRGFIIDGDEVRKHISTDLGYSLTDRKTQIERIFGLACITIKNGYFPVMSSVIMDTNMLDNCINNNILVVEIKRPLRQIHAVRDIYNKNSFVVGKDILQDDLETIKIFNDGTPKFDQYIRKYAQQKKLLQSY